MEWTHGSFYWNELMTRDAAQAMKFYKEALEWGFDAMPIENGTYWIAKSGDRPVDGIREMEGAEFKGMPERWMAYIAVDDIDARVKKAKAGGAKVIRPQSDVPGVGRIATLNEPGDAEIGWMTPKSA